jgi:NTP pyrophosphatase (non-canonical NTP hydrolase)
MRDEVRRFAEKMEEKLKVNDQKYKDGWDNCSIDFLTYRLRQETAELFEALRIYYTNPHELSKKLVEDECADVANFAMMIMDLVNKKTGGR